MAIFHLSVKAVRKAGSALGRAAHHTGTALKRSHGAAGKATYLAGERIVGADGVTTDYTGKHGVEHSQLILPGGGTCERESFWNAVDAHKTQTPTAIVARDIIVNLPHELTFEQRKAAAVELATWIADRYGVAVDLGMHEPETHKGSDSRNYHAHMLVSERQVSPTGDLGKVQRQLNAMVCKLGDESRGRVGGQKTAVAEFREAWQRIGNAHLEAGGHSERIDCRTLKEQGIEREPGIHRGAAATRVLREQVAAATIREELAETLRRHAASAAAAHARIAEIQNARMVRGQEPDTMHADIGSLKAWQRDAIGMLARYWAAEDRAADMRRRMREQARKHVEMRAATETEDRALRMAARQLTRSKSRLRETELLVRKADGLDQSFTIGGNSRLGTKARLAAIDKAIDPKILWKRDGPEMEI